MSFFCKYRLFGRCKSHQRCNPNNFRCLNNPGPVNRTHFWTGKHWSVSNKQTTKTFISDPGEVGEKCGKFFLQELAKLTNRLHSNSQCESLINGLPVMMTPIGWKELISRFWRDSWGHLVCVVYTTNFSTESTTTPSAKIWCAKINCMRTLWKSGNRNEEDFCICSFKWNPINE